MDSKNYNNYVPPNLYPEYVIENPTLNDLASMDEIRYIFNIKFNTQIRGVTPDRVANKFAWQRVTLIRRVSFIRRHVHVSAALADAFAAGFLKKPRAIDTVHVQNHFLEEVEFQRLKDKLKAEGMTDRYARAEVYDIPTYPNTPAREYLSVDEVTLLLGVVRETTYKLSDIRGTDLPLQTVAFSGIRFWKPESLASYIGSDIDEESYFDG